MINILKTITTPNFLQQSSWAVLRLIVSVMMIHNGFDKLGNIESFAEAYVAFIGLPFPVFFSYCAAYAEIIGSILLIVGLLSRIASCSLLITMSVAIYHHILVAGISFAYLELSAVYWSIFLFFTINGPGLFSTDGLLSNQSFKYKDVWNVVNLRNRKQ